MSTDSESGYSRKNPFPAKLSVNRALTSGGSNKDTRHFEITLEGSGLRYEVGDSLGVFPSNSPTLVQAILDVLGFTGEEAIVSADGVATTLKAGLMHNFILTEPSKQLLQAAIEKDANADFLRHLLDPTAKADLEKYLWGRDVLDVLEQFPGLRGSPEEVVKWLRKLQPRLYSIASSQNAVGDSVHLTVAVVRYVVPHSSRAREGVYSSFLAERTETVPVFVHTAKHFRLPEDASAPVIMVGPGTGVAPFRAFIQERAVTGATGQSWLFFGEQRAATDFLYQEEFEAAVNEGKLTRLTTAFSRDQDAKIYVQHRMLEHGADIYAWLTAGGYFYVCGDAQRMAKDVEAALILVAEKYGDKSPEQAKEFVDALKKEKRYRKDVY